MSDNTNMESENLNPEEMAEETETKEIIELMGDKGERLKFEYADTLEYKNKKYAALISLDIANEEVLFLEITPVDDNPDNDIYNFVTENKISSALYDLFKKNNADRFDFDD